MSSVYKCLGGILVPPTDENLESKGPFYPLFIELGIEYAPGPGIYDIACCY